MTEYIIDLRHFTGCPSSPVELLDYRPTRDELRQWLIDFFSAETLGELEDYNADLFEVTDGNPELVDTVSGYKIVHGEEGENAG